MVLEPQGPIVGVGSFGRLNFLDFSRIYGKEGKDLGFYLPS